MTQAVLVLGRFDSRAVLVSGRFDPDSDLYPSFNDHVTGYQNKMATSPGISWTRNIKPLLSASYSTFNKDNLPEFTNAIIARYLFQRYSLLRCISNYMKELCHRRRNAVCQTERRSSSSRCAVIIITFYGYDGAKEKLDIYTVFEIYIF